MLSAAQLYGEQLWVVKQLAHGVALNENQHCTSETPKSKQNEAQIKLPSSTNFLLHANTPCSLGAFLSNYEPPALIR